MEMEIVLEIIKVTCLFLGILFTIANLPRQLHRGRSLPTMNVFSQAIGITGFIYLQWLM